MKVEKYSSLRIIAILVAISLISISCKDSEKKIVQHPNQNYLNQVETRVNSLSETNKKNRNQLLSDLKSNSTYKELVEQKTISPDYLTLLSAINYGVRFNHINEGKGRTAISSSQQTNINKQSNSSDKMNFVVKVISLTTPDNGGLTKELVEVFDRYKQSYGMYGESQVEVGTSQMIPEFDISAIITMMNPNSRQNLNSLYEANKSVSTWFKDDLNYYFPYLANKKSYNLHLKEVYPNSPYVLNVHVEITANKLFADYKANQVMADEKYLNKKLAVTGVIGEIGKDIFNTPEVSLKIDYLQNVKCQFDESDLKLLSKLRKGSRITIIGVCEGKPVVDVLLKDCKIYDN